MWHKNVGRSLCKLTVLFILLSKLAFAELQSSSKILKNGEHQIYTELYSVAPDSKTSEVMMYITGQGDAISMYEYLVKDFIDRFGRDVFLYDVRGQGKSSGPRCHIDDYSEHLSDLGIVLENIRKSYGKIHIVAHSTGALISSLYILEGLDASAIKSLTLISPFFGLAGPNMYRRFAGVASEFGTRSLGLGQTQILPFNPAVYVSTSKNNLMTHDPDFFKIFNGHPEKCGTPSFAWIQASIAAHERLKDLKQQILVPMLMLTAGEDGVVSTADAKKQCVSWNDIKQASCTYHEYEGMRHGLIYEIKEVREDIYHRIGKVLEGTQLE